MLYKICHLTSVHNRYDVRIFWKESVSLKKAGFDVSLIVADGFGDEIKEGVQIFDVSKETKRIKRILNTPKKVKAKAIEVNADVYHFHDPELIPTALKLIKKGKKVIYDVHEDVPRQLLTKPYLKDFIKPVISRIFEIFENRAAKKFTAIVAATDFIKERFLEINKNSYSVKNYPIISELNNEKDYFSKENKICYIGSISEVRGIKEIVSAMKFIDSEMELAGNFNTNTLRGEVIKIDGWQKITEHGFVGREKTAEILAQSRVGLVTLYPTINYKDALPVKMFEYMMAGIPFVASDIELWKTIANENNCGLTANPYKPDDIAEKVNFLLQNSEQANKMGQNGKKAIKEKFNWGIESQILIEVYKKIL